MVNLFDSLPDYYNSGLIKNIITAINNEFDRYKEDCQNTHNELAIYSASNDLEEYEKDFVINASNNYDSDFRISKIISKLRGQGIITVERIKDICQSYSNGEVSVTPIPREFTLLIKFIGTKGIPPNIDDLKNILNQLKAGDWTIIYEFSYITWNERDNYNYTWDEWEALNLTWDEYETYIGEGE